MKKSLKMISPFQVDAQAIMEEFGIDEADLTPASQDEKESVV